MIYIPDSTKKKAELISVNKVYLPRSTRLPYPMEKSAAGPSSGTQSITLSFNDKHVKLAVSRDTKECFSLQQNGENNCFQILKKNILFLKNVRMVPILFHAPDQAFMNIENRCIHNCAFCNLSNTKMADDGYDADYIAKLILNASNRNDFKAVALTSGVYPNSKMIIRKMCHITKTIKKTLPSIPIGVEPLITDREEIALLKKAGADEIKINLQIPDRNLFKKICPGLSYDNILDMLIYAVKIFGEGKVTSNILYGFGETDDTVVQAVEKLAEIGVTATLRRIRINKLNKTKIEKSLLYKLPSNVSASRILRLAVEQKKVFKKYGLTPETFKTMCHRCGCCDIVPFIDL